MTTSNVTRYVPTKTLSLHEKHFCAFCGEVAEEDVHYSSHGRDKDITYKCCCLNATTFHTLEEKKQGLQRELYMLECETPKPNQQLQYIIERVEFETAYHNKIKPYTYLVRSKLSNIKNLNDIDFSFFKSEKDNQ